LPNPGVGTVERSRDLVSVQLNKAGSWCQYS
jgi:hypothetical protein